MPCRLPPLTALPFDSCQRPWMAAESGSNADAGLGDRISAVIIFEGKATTFVDSTDADNTSPLYFGQGSYILDPYEAKPLCAYGGDGATRGKICIPRGVSGHCIPACMPSYSSKTKDSSHMWDRWCKPKSRPDVDFWCEGHPWHPEDIGTMLEKDRLATSKGVHSTGHGMTYNEIVLDGIHSNKQLPKSIEAFVVSDGDKLETVKRMHAAFLRQYSLQASVVPLLDYRPDAQGDAFRCIVC